MATTRPVHHGHAHHADHAHCDRTDHAHYGSGKYTAHNGSETCAKVMILSVLIAVVGSMFWLMNRQQ